MVEIDKKSFGAFVASLRREKGFTQKELAEKLFISDKAVSKWETGASIPDTPLLIPLSELLGVTVTELLLCERTADIGAEQAEDAVKAALTYSGEKACRAYETRNRWPILYVCALVIGLTCALFSARRQALSETVTTALVLGAIFGGYFCFFVKTKLPIFYDQNRCGLYYDGPFRMNVPGITFNNSNWPHIVRVGRIWSCLTIVLCPLLNLAMNRLNAPLWLQAERYVFLALLLGGLFFPIYIVGKKYE